MRVLAAVAVLAAMLSACSLPVTSAHELRLGFDGQARHRSSARRPSWSAGIRFFLTDRRR